MTADGDKVICPPPQLILLAFAARLLFINQLITVVTRQLQRFVENEWLLHCLSGICWVIVLKVENCLFGFLLLTLIQGQLLCVDEDVDLSSMCLIPCDNISLL